MSEVIYLQDRENLVETAEYPDYAHWPFEKFNPPQSCVFDVFHQDANIGIAAATAAGKTVCAEMFIAHEVRVRGGKAMYLGTHKALVQEKLNDWKDFDHHFSDLNISICSGDYQLTEARKKELANADIITMTSEMLASRCRNFKSEKNNFLLDIGTLIVDESHLLTVPGRGDHLEVALMKITKINPNLRIVLLSATMPNVVEICEWLSFNLNNKDTYYLNSKYRPVPLDIHYPMYYDKDRYDRVESNKVNAALDIVMDYPDDKFLIFAHTKRTGDLMKSALRKHRIEADFHNANLSKTNRLKLENDFCNPKKSLRCLVATSTVAWGCCRHGTKISMSDGTLKNIENVRVGDEVFSLQKGGEFKPKKVLRIGSKKINIALKVTLETGEEVEVSQDHPFYAAMKRNSPDWVEAKEIRIGDFLAVPNSSSLRLFKEEVLWKRIKSIKKVEGGLFQDLEVEGSHNYVGNGIISHNCNLPARRVIVLGVHRGLSEVDTYDIFQMVGRSGRPKYDKKGDAYILLPQTDVKKQKARITNPTPITSQLLENHKVLAFHLVSEIHQRTVKTIDDIHEWFSRSLASYQSHNLELRVDDTIEALLKCGAIVESDGIYDVTSIGRIASMFYYSPFDVADLKRNFKGLFENNKQDNDYWLSMALGNTDTNRLNIVTKADKEVMGDYYRKIDNMTRSRPKPFLESAVKAGYAYHCLLTGSIPPSIYSFASGLKTDFDRLVQVLNVIDNFTGQWEMQDWFDNLSKRVTYGARTELLPLVEVAEVGKVRAERLYEKNIRSPQDIIDDPQLARAVLNVKTTVFDKIMESARALAFKSMF